MEYIINTLGGYDSVGFMIAIIIYILIGAPLIRLHWAFTAMPILGCALLLNHVTYLVDRVPNPPFIIEILPLLFSISIIVGVFVGFARNSRQKTKGAERND